MGRQGGRQTDRHIGRQARRHPDTQTDTQRQKKHDFPLQRTQLTTGNKCVMMMVVMMTSQTPQGIEDGDRESLQIVDVGHATWLGFV